MNELYRSNDFFHVSGSSLAACFKLVRNNVLVFSQEGKFEQFGMLSNPSKIETHISWRIRRLQIENK
jgi:hypothetical protein